MKLSEYTPRLETVPLSGDGASLEVRGLGVDAITALVRGQGQEVRDLYEKAMKGELDEQDITEILTQLLDEAPVMVALIIAYGCDDGEAWQQAADLPFADQVLLIEKIAKLTFANEGGAKKILEIVNAAIKFENLDQKLGTTSTDG